MNVTDHWERLDLEAIAGEAEASLERSRSRRRWAARRRAGAIRAGIIATTALPFVAATVHHLVA